MVAQHQVLLDAEVHHQALGYAVRRDAGHAEGGDPVGRGLGRVLAADPDGAGCRVAHADHRVEQGVLAVARHSRHPHDLTGADRDGEPFQRAAAGVGLQVDPVHLQHWLSGLGGGLVGLHQHLASHHHPSEIALVDVGGIDRADDLAAAEHRHPVREIHHLPELVGDQNDGETLVSHPAKDAEQLLDSLRGQHRGGLVQDQDLDAEVERLEDLHPLLLADREAADLGVGIDLHVVVVEELVEAAPGLGEV